MSQSFDQFRRDNVVTTIPTTLAYGQEVYYKDPNGNLTLWVGHEDGSAWPAVGYKELTLVGTDGGGIDNYHISTNAIGAVVSAPTSDTIQVSFSETDLGKISIITTYNSGGDDPGSGQEVQFIKTNTSATFLFWDGGGNLQETFPATVSIFIRIYP